MRRYIPCILTLLFLTSSPAVAQDANTHLSISDGRPLVYINTGAFVEGEHVEDSDEDSYTLIAGDFFNEHVQGFWLGFWDSATKSEYTLDTAEHLKTLFSLGSGYGWEVYNNVYLHSWAAVHANAAINRERSIDGESSSDPDFFTMTLSVTIGWRF